MNALPLKNPASPQAEIEYVIASYGPRKVLLVLAARLFRRSRPPDGARATPLTGVPGYLRKDIGLPPEPPPRVLVDLSHLRRDFWR